MRRLGVLAACLAIVSCTGSPGAPVPGPHFLIPSGLQVSPGSISLAPGGDQTVDVSEAGFSGQFTAQTSDSDVATVAPDGSTQFVVTAQNPGSATITISDGSGNSRQIGVSVQVTIIGGQ